MASAFSMPSVVIFITPRDFLKSPGSARLNTWLFDQGTLTDFQELGDARVFDGVVPNCAIWRFEKGNLTRRLADGRRMVLAGGQILLTRGIYSVPLASVFAVNGLIALIVGSVLLNVVCAITHDYKAAS